MFVALASPAAHLLAATEVSPPFPHLLSTLIVVPAVGALLVALVSRHRPETSRQLAVLMSAMTGALSVYLLVKFQQAEGDFQFVESSNWISEFGIGPGAPGSTQRQDQTSEKRWCPGAGARLGWKEQPANPMRA